MSGFLIWLRNWGMITTGMAIGSGNHRWTIVVAAAATIAAELLHHQWELRKWRRP